MDQEAAPDGPQQGSSPLLPVAKRACHDGGLPQGEVGVDRFGGLLVVWNKSPEQGKSLQRAYHLAKGN